MSLVQFPHEMLDRPVTASNLVQAAEVICDLVNQSCPVCESEDVLTSDNRFLCFSCGFFQNDPERITE